MNLQSNSHVDGRMPLGEPSKAQSSGTTMNVIYHLSYLVGLFFIIGETVKRGQTIAKSGQSGNVASPQLHFELRKGTKPVDPTQYLAGV